MEPEALARAIVDECRALGFHRVGIAPVEPARRHQVYRDWLASGRADRQCANGRGGSARSPSE